MSITFPAPDLASQVDFVWSFQGGRGRRHHELLPDGGVHLVLRLAPDRTRAALLGPATGRRAMEVAPGAEYLGVRFRVGRAPRLADLRAVELTDGAVELARLAGRAVDSLGDELLSTADPARRQALLEAVLRRPLPPLVADRRCRTGAALLDARAGRVRVAELAQELGLGHRTLERMVLRELGMTPRALIRLVRLRHVLGALRERAAGSLADLAQAFGYADQAHLTREFRSLTGRTPGQPLAYQARPLSADEAAALRRG
jgi:AraC-like DNA-binding protein